MDETRQNARIFDELLFFQSCLRHRNKANNSLIFLASWILAEGREDEIEILDVLKVFSTSVSCPLPSARKQMARDNSRIVSCFVKLKSVLFNLLCVFDLFSFQNACSQLCFRFFGAGRDGGRGGERGELKYLSLSAISVHFRIMLSTEASRMQQGSVCTSAAQQ